MAAPLKFGSKGSGDFKGLGAGSYISVCNAVVDMGYQAGSSMYPDPKHKVWIRFEVPDERIEYEKDGKKLEGPRVISKEYTASMHEKANLRKDLESWRGKAFTDDEAANFDVSSILGKGCMLTVIEKDSGGKTFSNIASIGSLPKRVESPKAENSLLYYAPGETECFSKLPEWVQEKIKKQIVDEPRKVDYDDGDPGISDADLPESMLQDDDSESIPF